MDTAEVKEMVRARYSSIAAGAASDCCAPSCCGGAAANVADSKSAEMGYSAAELAAVPEGANLGLGCGNPQAIAAMKPGEIVIVTAIKPALDLRCRPRLRLDPIVATIIRREVGEKESCALMAIVAPWFCPVQWG
jgi:hypothetical protein